MVGNPAQTVDPSRRVPPITRSRAAHCQAAAPIRGTARSRPVSSCTRQTRFVPTGPIVTKIMIRTQGSPAPAHVRPYRGPPGAPLERPQLRQHPGERARPPAAAALPRLIAQGLRRRGDAHGRQPSPKFCRQGGRRLCAANGFHRPTVVCHCQRTHRSFATPGRLHSGRVSMR